jgi:hypothetical protein
MTGQSCPRRLADAVGRCSLAGDSERPAPWNFCVPAEDRDRQAGRGSCPTRSPRLVRGPKCCLRRGAALSTCAPARRRGCCAQGLATMPLLPLRSATIMCGPIGKLVCGRRRAYAPDATGSGRVALLVFLRRECRGGGRRDAPCRARCGHRWRRPAGAALPSTSRRRRTSEVRYGRPRLGCLPRRFRWVCW